ncbi:uncharacterized protein LOC133850065 isoform X1 [Drosophila sulfurigaster albostrigata]|uniref:uncharacterized protein LOC133850065 isoform X1 n=1 Tax=Drosophila sulfurigaster albostrigata TaxID=89887 RepID=UPI002D21BD28|nr:uncharacterized protein LOC133850065 isoform X1 [Drosophila sulfurigaster albostrigata]
MKTQLFVLIICLSAGAAFAQEEELIEILPPRTTKAPEKGVSDPKIIRILEDNSKKLDILDRNTHTISNTQKGIENKLKAIARDLSEIEHIEDDLKKLEKLTADNFKSTAQGVKNLTNNIKSAEDRTDRAILGLSRTQQEIKQVLIQVDANQNKYEADLNNVAKSVHDHLDGLDSVLKQSVLKELVNLNQAAKKLENSQKHIENKIGYLDELAALTGITANKVQLLEQGVRSLNVSQQLQLSAISETVHQVGSTTWQIDNKLGVLLSTQKNIERGLEECKKCQRHPAPEPYHEPKQYEDSYGEPKQHEDSYAEPKQHEDSYAEPRYAPEYGRKEPSKSSSSSSSNSEYGSDYSNSNAEEASYLYQLWYGKDQK